MMAVEKTFNGETFTELDTPTAQFYHVSVDNEFPYNIYGAQQDNSSIRIASRSSGNDIGPESWYAVAGGEAGYIEADPTNADITYGGEYDGQLSSFNKTGQGKDISVSRIEYWSSFQCKKNTVFNGRTQLFFASQPKKECMLLRSTRDRRSRSFI
jgi:hypothetical protein